MNKYLFAVLLATGCLCVAGLQAENSAGESPALGLPPVPYPQDNPQTAEKVALGDKLFHDERFSSTGKVSCSSCHGAEKAFTDSPLKTSEGIEKLTGTEVAAKAGN